MGISADTRARLQRSPVRVWAELGIPAPGKAGGRSLAGSGHGAGATLGVGAAVGAVPAVIPLSQSGSSSFPGCLPLSPLTPNTRQHEPSAAGWLGLRGRKGCPLEQGGLLSLH